MEIKTNSDENKVVLEKRVLNKRKRPALAEIKDSKDPRIDKNKLNKEEEVKINKGYNNLTNKEEKKKEGKENKSTIKIKYLDYSEGEEICTRKRKDTEDEAICDKLFLTDSEYESQFHIDIPTYEDLIKQ